MCVVRVFLSRSCYEEKREEEDVGRGREKDRERGRREERRRGGEERMGKEGSTKLVICSVVFQEWHLLSLHVSAFFVGCICSTDLRLD